MPFTDSQMKITQIYLGNAEKTITVMQTGGTLAAADGDNAMDIVTADDPIFVRDSEHILFLKEITGDEVHAKSRKLYRIINPASRYEVNGTSASNLTHTSSITVQELEVQIEEAVSKK